MARCVQRISTTRFAFSTSRYALVPAAAGWGALRASSVLLPLPQGVYGFVADEPLVFEPVDKGVFAIRDTMVDLEDISSSALPRAPRPPSLSMHWLAVEGVQPRIPSNPGSESSWDIFDTPKRPAVSAGGASSDPASGDTAGRVTGKRGRHEISASAPDSRLVTTAHGVMVRSQGTGGVHVQVCGCFVTLHHSCGCVPVSVSRCVLVFLCCVLWSLAHALR